MAQFGERPSRGQHHLDDLERCDQPVAGRRHLRANQVSGRLAAQDGSLGDHALAHVAIADRGAQHPPASLFHGRVDAEVALHRHHKDVPCQRAAPQCVDRQHGHQLIAVQDLPALVTENTAITIAVMRNAQPRRGGAYRRCEVPGMLAAHPGVDVPAIGLVADADYFSPEGAQHCRARAAGGAVCRVEDNPPAFETRAGQDPRNSLDILGSRGRKRLDGGGGAVFRHDSRRELLLDLMFLGIGQLAPRRSEELDPVVAGGIMRSGDHHPERGPLAKHGARHCRGGHDPKAERGQTLAGKSGRQRRLQHGPRGPRVVSDQNHRSLSRRPSNSSVLQPATRRLAEPARKLRIDERPPVGAANAVGSKILADHEL